MRVTEFPGMDSWLTSVSTRAASDSESAEVNSSPRRPILMGTMSLAPTSLQTKLSHAHRLGREACVDALVLARQVENEAAEVGDPVSYARALALQGKLLLAQGALQEACTTATRLEVASPESDNAFVVVAIATFQAQLAFFLGSYRDAIKHATAAIAAADASGDDDPARSGAGWNLLCARQPRGPLRAGCHRAAADTERAER